MTKIKVNITASYFSEIADALPTHAYIDKTVCGVGMTSVALENDMHTLLLVPTKLLVENKVNQYPNQRCTYTLQAVTGDVDDTAIKYYVDNYQNQQPLKFICTYDSFFRLLPFAQQDNVRVIVDECDKMVSMSPLKVRQDGKADVINYMLTELEKIQDRVSFISSTPIPLGYFQGTSGAWLNELVHYVFNWTTAIRATPILCKRAKPVEALKKEVIQKIVANGVANIGDRTFGKAIIFMNSVKAICDVIHDCGIEDKSRIICSSSNEASSKLFDYGYDRLRLYDYGNLPIFTFITSSGFQGIDLYDQNAMTVVVSKGSGRKDSSFMLDLQLDVKQAVSRNRNKTNPNIDRFIFFFNQGVFDKSWNEVFAEINNEEKEVSYQVGEFRKINIVDDKKYLPPILRRYSYRDEKNRLCVNNLLFNYEKYTALEVIRMYQNGFEIMANITTTFNSPITVAKPREYQLTSYKSIHDKYKEQLSRQNVSWSAEEQACENFILVDRCYRITGKLYSRSNDAKAAIAQEEAKKSIDIASVVKSRIKPGKWACKDLKTELQQIYDSIGYAQTAKATDIRAYYPDSSDPISSDNGRYINVK